MVVGRGGGGKAVSIDVSLTDECGTKVGLENGGALNINNRKMLGSVEDRTQMNCTRLYTGYVYT